MKSKSEQGLSLIEIMIALAIVALILGAATITYRAVKRGQLKSSINQLAGMIKYAKDRAISSGHYYRLRFDFKEQSYELEQTETQVFLQKSTIGKSESLSEEDKLEEEDLEAIFPQKAKFEKHSDSLSKKVNLSSGVELKFVKLARFDSLISSGVTYLHFFPDGHVESAWICLSRKDEPDFRYSLEVKSPGGRAITKVGCPPLAEMK